MISGDSTSHITIFNLKEKKVTESLKLGEEKTEVTCITSFMFPGKAGASARAYCGLKNGKVYVVDVLACSVMTSFIAKKPSPVINVAAFDPEWNRLGEEKNQNKESSGSSQTSPLLVVSANHIRVYSLSDNVYLSKVSIDEGEIQEAYLKEIGGNYKK